MSWQKVLRGEARDEKRKISWQNAEREEWRWKSTVKIWHKILTIYRTFPLLASICLLSPLALSLNAFFSCFVILLNSSSILLHPLLLFFFPKLNLLPPFCPTVFSSTPSYPFPFTLWVRRLYIHLLRVKLDSFLRFIACCLLISEFCILYC